MVRHFLDMREVESADLRAMIDKARALKAERAAGIFTDPLKHKKLAMIFEKNSTRTRVSFEAGMLELGGHALPFSNSELQLGRGESVADTARVMSRYVDAIMLRCHSHATLKELAEYASVPIINGLSDECHPCQLMADILTIEEHRGPVAGKALAWVGDGNNMANSFITAAARFGFSLRLACPAELSPSPEAMQWARAQGAEIMLKQDPAQAVAGADAVITDTWVSMGDTDGERRMKLLSPYQVNAALMTKARPDALFLHCLPAHRGEEATAEVLDGPQSVIWEEAENRLHAQKAILLWCLGLL